MVPVATNHATHVVDGELLPRLIPNVLPAGNLFQDEETDFVASVEKMARLWIVRSPDDVALELVAQNLGIAALNAAGHGLSNERKSLMTIEASELDDFAVKLKTMIGKLRLATTKAAGVFINHLGPTQQTDANGIEISIFEVPELDSAEIAETHGGLGRLR